jgi:hypothetical protein
MKIYVSGPPIADLEAGDTNSAVIYRAIERKFGKEHDVTLPVRTHELDKLSARDFFAAMSQRINAAEGVITIIEGGDQSTPVEATIAAFSGKPQYVLEIAAAPRLIRGLPGITGGAIFSTEKLDHQLQEAIEQLIAASRPKPRERAA